MVNIFTNISKDIFLNKVRNRKWTVQFSLFQFMDPLKKRNADIDNMQKGNKRKLIQEFNKSKWKLRHKQLYWFCFHQIRKNSQLTLSTLKNIGLLISVQNIEECFGKIYIKKCLILKELMSITLFFCKKPFYTLSIHDTYNWSF